MTIPEAGDVVPPSEVGAGNGSHASSQPSNTGRSKLPRLPGNPVIDWLLVRTELARARAEAARLAPEQREFLRRAKLSLELGELAFAPGNAVRSGSTAPLAANLFRQAIYWALLAQRAHATPIRPEQLWSETDRSVLQSIAGNDGEYAYFTVAMRSSFIELAEGTEEAQRSGAVRLRRAARRLVDDAQRVLSRLEWAKLKRALRVGLALLIPAIALYLLWPAKVDLAKGATFRVSSVGAECHPEKSECGGVKTDVLFHTQLEKNPWFEYDFGAPTSFSSLTIQNRTDCCPERAVPLAVEVSNDDKTFKEVVRRDSTFVIWKPSFATQRARYLRLRILRDSMLHLEAIKVHP
ncbi:MAG TPA: discoidin domain-containing protein [Polyangiaceae bacterium]|jgi:hypothetical protein|nr:discoidin domain-containing protein [Polyangiaceae bacterium]